MSKHAGQTVVVQQISHMPVSDIDWGPITIHETWGRLFISWKDQEIIAVRGHYPKLVEAIEHFIEPAQENCRIGPQYRELKTCKGCAYFKSEYWKEPSGDGETYDSGTSAECTKANHYISTYYGSEPAVPEWCPFIERSST